MPTTTTSSPNGVAAAAASASATTSNSESTSTSLHSNINLREFESSSTKDVFKKYQVMEVLGHGSMGAVCKVKIKDDRVGGSAFRAKKKGILGALFGQSVKTGELREDVGDAQNHIYALKSIQLDRVSDVFLDELENEITILRTMDHPNIVKAFETYRARRQIYLILELCDGGDLYTRSPYSEKESAKLVSKLLSAIKYMHDHNIVHRDLKYENIMFENTSETAEIKVIDFGLSKKFLDKKGFMTDRVGTVYTMAPQVLQGVYSSKADMWSLGVITFMLLSATKPFYHRRRRKMVDMIMRADFQYTAPTWSIISDAGKDFVEKLLVVDPKVRYNAAAALRHDWIVHREKLPDERPGAELLRSIDSSLSNYRQASDLKKLALNVIAHRSTATAEVSQLRKVFHEYDTAKNGVITFEEFQSAFQDLKYDDRTIQEIFSSIDVNQNGHIMYTEFLAATIEARGHIEEDRIAEAFDRLDADDTGYISKKNLCAVLGQECSPELVTAIIKDADADGDGKISYQEFLTAFRTKTEDIADQMSMIGEDDIAIAGAAAGATGATGAADLDKQKGEKDDSDDRLVGLDAKIPGGRFDSDLSPTLRAQLSIEDKKR